MRAPSTLAFMLRWALLETIAGVAGVVAGIYLLLTKDDTPAPSSIASQVSSPFADFAAYAPLVFLVMGIALLVMGWNKASNLRNGGN